MAQMHKRVKISIISLRLWEIKELSESNIILQDCYNGHLAHFQYTSLSRLRKKFFHSTLVDKFNSRQHCENFLTHPTNSPNPHPCYLSTALSLQIENTALQQILS